MKSRISKESTTYSEYPKLMKSTGNNQVVLFDGYQSGMVVFKGDSPNLLGFYSDAWDMGYFTGFNGSVELTDE